MLNRHPDKWRLKYYFKKQEHQLHQYQQPTSETKVIRDSNLDFQIYSDQSQNVDALSCRCQSFCQVWYKSAVDCMRNTNKCPKIPSSAVVKKMEQWPRINVQIRITTKNWSLLEGHPLLWLPSLVDVRFRICQLPCLQNDRQNDHITSAWLAEVIIIKLSDI